MKKFKIITLFLLIFGLGLGCEKSMLETKMGEPSSLNQAFSSPKKIKNYSAKENLKGESANLYNGDSGYIVTVDSQGCTQGAFYYVTVYSENGMVTNISVDWTASGPKICPEGGHSGPGGGGTNNNGLTPAPGYSVPDGIPLPPYLPYTIPGQGPGCSDCDSLIIAP